MIHEKSQQKDGFQKRGKFWSYRMRIPDPLTGKTKEVRFSGFLTKAEAQSDRKIREAEVLEGRFVKPTKITVKEHFEEWFRVKTAREEIKTSSVEYYRNAMEWYIIPRLGQIALKDLSAEQIESFLIDLTQRGKRDGSPLSRSTVRGVAITLSQGLDRGVKLKRIPQNLMRQVEIPKGTTKIVSSYSAQQIKALLQKAEGHRLYAFLHLATHTGARRGELNALLWSDFDPDNGTISISKNRGMANGKILEQSTTKSKNGMRVIELDPETVRVLKQHKTRQNQERLLIGEVWKETGFIFTREDGDPIYPTTPTAFFDKVRKKADLPHLPFHGLRHSHATELLRSGIPAYIVAKRLGDEVQTVLKTYAHALKEDDQLSANTYAEKIQNA